ncbi:3-dehydroquinate dehydratase (3-dehydroquinase), partial [Cladochytrium tenue]
RAEAAAPAGSAGVVVELAYRPRETALLAAATSGSEGGFKWARVRGEDILLEQGVEQFERWTGRRAPRRAMAAQVLQRE